jgi:hypothetical protein
MTPAQRYRRKLRRSAVIEMDDGNWRLRFWAKRRCKRNNRHLRAQEGIV